MFPCLKPVTEVFTQICKKNRNFVNLVRIAGASYIFEKTGALAFRRRIL